MIKILDKKLADKIAAGEVVERPASIIKELIENSIDAKSTKITIEIKDGGKTYIRVTDNGIGIEKAEVSLAFFRHATSKIRTENDLEKIDTLGFRGEALASIAAVSKVEIITKSYKEDVASRSILWGGEILENTSFGAPQGTTIVIKDIFYNTPARLKFLKSNKSETSAIIEIVSNIAIAYPNIKFMFINNDKILFSTNGKGRLVDVVSTITSRIEASQLINVNFEKAGIKVYGLISNPSYTKASKKNQIFFVNGRVVNSKIIEKAIYDGYKERIFEGRHPVAYFFVDVEPEKLDVNIHPNKKEVKFDNEVKIMDVVKEGILESLNSRAALTPLGKKSFIDSNEANINDKTDVVLHNKENNNHELELYNFSRNKSVDLLNFEIDIIKDFEVKKENKNRIDKYTESVQEDIFSKNEYDSNRSLEFNSLEIMGQIFGTYILLKDEECMYLIDQHAAHERVFFEKFKKAYLNSKIDKQIIFSPYLITLSSSQLEKESIWQNILNRCGFTLQEFGLREYRVVEIPALFSIGESETFLRDFFDTLEENFNIIDDNISEKMASKACKAAIKGNSFLTTKEIEALLNQLEKCENPHSCPHGRPIFVKVEKKEIEKRFKRI